MKPKRPCAKCGATDRGMYLHHGQLYCGLCLRPDPEDDLIVRARITLIRTEETRDMLRKRRKPK
jgi:hypothetical protein